MENKRFCRCGNEWHYCDGNCESCTRGHQTASTSTEQTERESLSWASEPDGMKPIIELYATEMRTEWENGIMRAVGNAGVDVDKERLVQAINDARMFYYEGYEAAKKEMEELARNLHDVASNEQVTEPLQRKGYSDSDEPRATENQVTSDSGSCKNRNNHTNSGRFRSMTDEEWADYIEQHCADRLCELVCGHGQCKAIRTLTETAEQVCRRIVLEFLRSPAKEDT